METIYRTEAMNEITSAIDDAIDPSEMSPAEALEFLEEIAEEVGSRMEALRESMRGSQEGGEAKAEDKAQEDKAG